MLLNDPILDAYNALSWLHIAFGTVAIFLFWYPIITVKGSPAHKQAGRWYVYCLKGLCFSGAIMACMVLFDPQYMKPSLYTDRDPTAVTAKIHQFWGFLLFLCLMIYTNVSQATYVLKERPGSPRQQPLPARITPFLLGIASLVLLVSGISGQHILSIVFSLLGVSIAYGNCRYQFKQRVTRNEQIIEHIGNICGSGIGVYTAFFVFGGRSLFENLGQGYLLLWILPGVIGALLIARYTKQYKRPNAAERQKRAQS